MEKRKEEEGAAALPVRHREQPLPSRRLTPFCFLFSIFYVGALVSCGTPGDPVPPRPVVPEAVTDLTVRQSGEGTALSFTLPSKSTDGDALKEPPDVEIFRVFLPASVPPEASRVPSSPLYTVPSALVETYRTEGGRVVFNDPLHKELLAEHAGEQVLYAVRTRASKRRASADSNLVALRLYPVPERIIQLTSTVTQEAIELRWMPPERTTAGQPIPALGGFRIYRAEVPAEATPESEPPALRLLSVSPSPMFRDTQFEFGRAYVYAVRSVAQYEAEAVESADSELVRVTPRDTFPPAAPQNLVLVLVPAEPPSRAAFDLSWSISPETDLGGYHVYRSEELGTRGERISRELLPVPTFRDTSAGAGGRYFYRVTAVDRAGNESQASDPVVGEVPPAGGNAKQE